MIGIGVRPNRAITTSAASFLRRRFKGIEMNSATEIRPTFTFWLVTLGAAALAAIELAWGIAR